MFIEVNESCVREEIKKLIINTNKIHVIRPHEYKGTIIETEDNVYIVEESYEEVKSMIPTMDICKEG